jgi:hypothetical protein
MGGKISASQIPTAPREECDLVWHPLRRSRAGRAPASDFIVEGALLSAPMFVRRKLRIMIDPAIDLFAGDAVETSIDLVHAVIAVSHWHSFFLFSDSGERMRGYYADPETPRRVAEEIDFLSLLAVESAASRVSPLLLAGFARVRYGISASGANLICPLSPDPWPLANVTHRAVAELSRLSETSPLRE